MKYKVTIYQKNSNPIELIDESDMNRNEYCHNLSNVFRSSNVVILETSESSFLVRPSMIFGVNVNEYYEPKQIEYKTEPVEEIEDIITDVD